MKKDVGFIAIIIILAVLFASVVSLVEKANAYALYGAIPVAFVLSFARNRRLIVNSYFKIYIFLCLWLLFTAFFAIDSSVAFREMRQVLGAFLLSYIVSASAYNEKVKPWMYIAFILLYLSAIYYAYSNILYTGWDIGGERLNDEILNANKLAYYTFYATIAFYILAELPIDRRVLIELFRIMFLAMIPLSFWIAIMTASRQVLIIQIPTILILGYLRYFSHKNIKSIALTFAIVATVFLYASNLVINIYNDSYLKQRNEMEITDDSRVKLIENSFQVGLEHPILGVGPGNFGLISYNKHYSHCTYTELFANTGFLGFLLYAILVFRLLLSNIRRYRATQDRQYLVYATFALIFIFYNFFYVFYKDIWLTAFFMLVAADSDSYYRRKTVATGKSSQLRII